MAGAVVADEVIVSLEARMGNYEANLARANNTFNQKLGAIEARGQRFETSFAASTAGVTRQIRALTTAFGAFQLARFVTQAAASADQLVNVADRLGITTEKLQELEFAARDANVETGAFDQALSFFTRQLGEASRGSGEFGKLLAANGIAIRDARGELRPMQDVLADYIDLAGKAANETELGQISFRGFGRGASDLGTLLKGGAAGLRASAEEARRTGAIMDDLRIRKLAKLDDAFRLAGEHISEVFRELVVSAGPAITGIIGELTKLLGWLTDHPQVATVLGLTLGGLRFGGLAGAAIGAAAGVGIAGGNALAGVLDENALTTPVAGENPLQPGFRSVNDRFKGFGEGREGTATQADIAAAAARRKEKPGVILPDADAEAEQKAFAAQLLSLKQRTAAINTETEVIGKSVYEQERAKAQTDLLSAAQEHHIKITDAVRKSIDDTAEAYGRAAEAAAEAQRQFQESIELQSFAGNSLIDFLETATDKSQGFNEAISALAKSLAHAALQGAILGQGPLAGLFGTSTGENGGVGGLIGLIASAVGGGPNGQMYATGGMIPMGSSGTVGERGIEKVMATPGGAIVQPGAPRMKAASGAGPQVILQTSIDARGADSNSVAKLEEALAARDQLWHDNLPALITKAEMDRRL